MSTASDLEIFSNRIGDAYASEARRQEAARFYAQTIHDFSELSRLHQREAVARVSSDLEKFMLVASDPSESKALRILVMGMAMGDTLSNFSMACRTQRMGRVALLSSQEDFRNASQLGREASIRIPFQRLMDGAMLIAQDMSEDIHIRKGAIILFNKLLKIGTTSCFQKLDRGLYIDRFVDIAVGTDDKSLQLCAIKVGASGSEPHSGKTLYLSPL